MIVSLVDRRRQDPRLKDGLQKIFNLLENSTDTALVMKYGMWLVEKDSELGLQVSLSAPTVREPYCDGEAEPGHDRS